MAVPETLALSLPAADLACYDELLRGAPRERRGRRAQVKLYAKELKMPGLAAAFEEIVRDGQKAGRGASRVARRLPGRRGRLARRAPPRGAHQGGALPGAEELRELRLLARALAREGARARARQRRLHAGQGEHRLPGRLGHRQDARRQRHRPGGDLRRRRVRFTTAITLAQELLAAADEHRLPRYLKSWRSADLVIVDELGYLPLGPGAPLLFQFFAERYEAGSVLVTTNLEFSRWSEVFGDATLTAALLDRLTHHSQVLLFEG